ncbi:hypothetical protein PIB30_002210 [Stylosanthes scabra]|uniref:Uncharacterized protein n=1 Tax=Stylosanthes scabra TaxID=79078 RepID=A0ABU6T2N7_9FABA|nr:hypothetical protein [Stylosanthes scabra]
MTIIKLQNNYMLVTKVVLLQGKTKGGLYYFDNLVVPDPSISQQHSATFSTSCITNFLPKGYYKSIDNRFTTIHSTNTISHTNPRSGGGSADASTNNNSHQTGRKYSSNGG